MKIILERSDVKGWRVAKGATVLFTGGRVAAKRFADGYCRSAGVACWFNRKVGGALVAISVRLFALLAVSASAQTATETVAAVLVAEAGGEGVAAMRAVREVVQMRAYEQQRSELAVVTARRQFSCLNRLSPARLVAIARSHPRWPDAMRLASSPVRQATVWQANHYHAVTIRPAWVAGVRPVAVVGGHAFYRLNK